MSYFLLAFREKYLFNTYAECIFLKASFAHFPPPRKKNVYFSCVEKLVTFVTILTKNRKPKLDIYFFFYKNVA